MAGEICVTGEDLLDGGAPEEVIVQFAAFGVEDHLTIQVRAEVEIGAVAVIEEDAIGAEVLPAEIEGDVLIDGVGAFFVAGRVTVPHAEDAAALVEAGGFFAEAIEVLFHVKRFGGADCAGGGVVRHGLRVGIDDFVALSVAELDEEWRACNGDFKFRGGEEDGGGVFFDGELRGGGCVRGGGGVESPGVIAFGERLVEAGADADEVGRDDLEADLGLIGAGDEDAVGGTSEGGEGADGRHAFEVGGSGRGNG